eukprot:2034262-Pleurochrysis_carterae.AAC.1
MLRCLSSATPSDDGSAPALGEDGRLRGLQRVLAAAADVAGHGTAARTLASANALLGPRVPRAVAPSRPSNDEAVLRGLGSEGMAEGGTGDRAGGREAGEDGREVQGCVRVGRIGGVGRSLGLGALEGEVAVGVGSPERSGSVTVEMNCSSPNAAMLTPEEVLSPMSVTMPSPPPPPPPSTPSYPRVKLRLRYPLAAPADATISNAHHGNTTDNQPLIAVKPVSLSQNAAPDLLAVSEAALKTARSQLNAARVQAAQEQSGLQAAMNALKAEHRRYKQGVESAPSDMLAKVQELERQFAAARRELGADRSMRENAFAYARAQSAKAAAFEQKLEDSEGKLAKEKARAEGLEAAVKNLCGENEKQINACRTAAQKAASRCREGEVRAAGGLAQGAESAAAAGRRASGVQQRLSGAELTVDELEAESRRRGEEEMEAQAALRAQPPREPDWEHLEKLPSGYYQVAKAKGKHVNWLVDVLIGHRSWRICDVAEALSGSGHMEGVFED